MTTLTREAILSADPAALRLLVAEHVMGRPLPLRRGPTPHEAYDCHQGCRALHPDDCLDAAGVRLPDYATDPGAAWLVVERSGLLSSAGEGDDNVLCGRHKGGWMVQRVEVGDDYYNTTTFETVAEGATMPEAVCRAAVLMALDRRAGEQQQTEG